MIIALWAERQRVKSIVESVSMCVHAGSLDISAGAFARVCGRSEQCSRDRLIRLTVSVKGRDGLTNIKTCENHTDTDRWKYFRWRNVLSFDLRHDDILTDAHTCPQIHKQREWERSKVILLTCSISWARNRTIRQVWHKYIRTRHTQIRSRGDSHSTQQTAYTLDFNTELCSQIEIQVNYLILFSQFLHTL